MHGAVPRDARNPQAGALGQINAVRESTDILLRHDHQLRRSPKGSVALSSEAPDALSDTNPRNSLADVLDDTTAITVRNDPRERHPYGEGIAPLLDVAGAHAGRRNADQNFPGSRLGGWHLTDD